MLVHVAFGVILPLAGCFLTTLNLRSDPVAFDEGLPLSPGAMEWAEDQIAQLDSSYLR